MTGTQDPPSEWATLWDRVRGDGSAVGGTAVLVPEDADGPQALAKAREPGRTPTGQHLLLTAATAGIAAAHPLPENAQVASAPMEGYDVAEISVFDHPVCSGRISVGDAAAVIGSLRFESPQVRDSYEAALLATLAEEAFLHGAYTLILIVDPDDADRFLASGWTAAGRVLSFGPA